MGRNPAREALGEWRAVPATLPRPWLKNELSPYARYIGLELFRRCDDDYQGIVAVNDPWPEDVCKQLEITGSHRNAAKAALRALVKAGLLRPLKGRIFIELGQKGAVADAAREEPISNSDQTTSESKSNHVQITSESPVNQQSTQVAEIVKLPIDRVGKEREGEGREGSRARASADVDPRFGPVPPHALRELHTKQQQAPAAKPATYSPGEAATLPGRLVESVWQQLCLQFWIAKSWEEPAVLDGLGEALELSATGSNNTLDSVTKCCLYRFAVLCKAHNEQKIPALKWLFKHGKLSQCLHEGADKNPPAYQMVSVVEKHLEAAQ